jgi:HD-GYP domain-containing protein (c-di-GMP phosphodiesterase class II)
MPMPDHSPEQLPPAAVLKLSELIGALSHALDITEGRPAGHCVRCCWIGMHIGREVGLPDDQLWELYYTPLLKDLGCSSNAARICELYLTAAAISYETRIITTADIFDAITAERP